MTFVEKSVLYVQMPMHENNLAIAHDDGDMCCLVCRLSLSLMLKFRDILKSLDL